MPKKINAPTLVKAEGTKLKIIEEYIGRVNTGTTMNRNNRTLFVRNGSVRNRSRRTHSRCTLC